VAEAIEAPGELGVHVVTGLEVIDFRGDLGAPHAGIEARDTTHGRPLSAQAIPELGRAGADGSDGPDAGHSNALKWSAAILMHRSPPSGRWLLELQRAVRPRAQRRRVCGWR